MARPRSRIRRNGAWAAALLLLLGLFQLNQWLPGGWPGGGGEGGFREADAPRPDLSRLRPPLGAPPTWPATSIVVTLRGPQGPVDAGWRLRAADGSTFEPDASGAVRLDDGRALARGFVIEGPGDVRVEHGPASPRSPFVVHLPEPAAAPEAGAGATLALEVRGAKDGAPLEGVEVAWRGWGEAGLGRTDTRGALEAPSAVTRLLVSLRAPDRFGTDRWIDPRHGPVSIVLYPRPASEVRFVEQGTATPLEVDHLRVLDADGGVWLDTHALLDPTGPRDRLDLDRVPGSPRVEGAILEVGAPEHPVVQVPLAAVPPVLELTRGRPFRIRTLDERGSPVRRSRIEAHYRPQSALGAEVGLSERREVTREVGDTAYLPEGWASRLLVQAGASAPRAVEIGPEESPGRRDVRLAPGGRLEVEVVADEDSRPLAGAQVLLAAVVEGLRLERRAATDADGRATLEDLPRGWVEVYAHSRGRGWGVATLELGEAKGAVTLRLKPGRTLRLIVETPTGLPLPGVRVHADPVGDGAADVVPPGARAVRTGTDGALAIPDLLDRDYRLRLSKPGYHPRELEGVRPGDGVHFVTLVPRDG